MRDELLIRDVWERCRANALHAMRRGAEFYRYPLLPEEPASIYDTSLDPEGRPVTVDWLIFKFERPGDGDQNAVIKITCEGLLVETV